MNRSFPALRIFATVLLLFLQFALHAQTSADRERIHIGLEFGRFNYTWYGSSSRLSEVERLPSDRYHVAIRADRHIQDNFGISLSLFFADYQSRGSTHAEPDIIPKLDRDTTAYVNIAETFIGPEAGITYRIGLPFIKSKLYLLAGMRYGILLKGQAKGTIIRVGECYRNSAGEFYVCDIFYSRYDSDDPRYWASTFTTPGNSFTVYSSLGLVVGTGKFKPYVELRGNLGRLGVLDQAYGYNEYGLVGGVRF